MLLSTTIQHFDISAAPQARNKLRFSEVKAFYFLKGVSLSYCDVWALE